MNDWLDPLWATLDAAPCPVSFFFRNDDAGWKDERLFELLYTFSRHSVPLDVAVIPNALSANLATGLRRLLEIDGELLSLHQHGYAHLNHELAGRKCEFGLSRSRTQQLSDIQAGKKLLSDLCGPIDESIFTPPWNRCTAITGECLLQSGFGVLSRDASAAPLNIQGLFELPVSIDWLARRKGVRVPLNETGFALAHAASGDVPVGMMLHHAAMDDEDDRNVNELLVLLASNSQARCGLMTSVVNELGGTTAKTSS